MNCVCSHSSHKTDGVLSILVKYFALLCFSLSVEKNLRDSKNCFLKTNCVVLKTNLAKALASHFPAGCDLCVFSLDPQNTTAGFIYCVFYTIVPSVCVQTSQVLKTFF